MFEELYAPLPDPKSYLKRIGLEGAEIKTDKESLDRVLKAHLRHIPFDDLDVWAKGVCPSLAVEDLYNKVVVNGRGGYCFELNSLFKAFLLSLGFDAYTVICHLCHDPSYIAVPAHCGVIVKIGDMKYFTDVGYGGKVPDEAVALDGAVHGGYRSGTDGYYTYVEEMIGNEGKRVFLFKDLPALPVELVPLNFNVSQNAGSRFRTQPLLNLRYSDGNVLVTGRSFKLVRGDERIERELKDMEELKEVAKEYFGVGPENASFRELDQ
ncbi:MAG: arylamine N-acetyltransferase [Firmicutes bacterium]|nr:arylamine N-acetyltransferase [Bacillota bacterium]